MTAPAIEGVGFTPPFRPREGNGWSSIVLADGTALVGGRSHPQAIAKAYALGLLDDEALTHAKAGLTRADGSSFEISGAADVLPVMRVIWLDDPSNRQERFGTLASGRG
jgi:hypothetical protein